MNEQEQRINQGLRALDEAHRLGRLGREDYRARRRALLEGLNDSNGVTARNAIAPAATGGRPHEVRRQAPPGPDMAGTLFPDRRRRMVQTWLLAVAGLALALLLIYGVMQLADG